MDKAGNLVSLGDGVNGFFIPNDAAVNTHLNRAVAQASLRGLRPGSLRMGIHGNSKKSAKPQHGYVIKDKTTGEVQEYGISGQKLNKDGTSPRVQQKIRQKYGNSSNVEGRVIKKNMRNRRKGLNWEQGKVNSYSNSKFRRNGIQGERPPRQLRPSPDI